MSWGYRSVLGAAHHPPAVRPGDGVPTDEADGVVVVALVAGAVFTGAGPAAEAFPFPYVMLDRCEMYISLYTTYLYNVVGMLDKRLPYLWSFS